MSVLNALSVSRKPALSFVAVGLFWGTFAAFLPETKAGLGVSDAVMGVLLLGNAIGLVVAMMFAPWLEQILGARSLQVSVLLFASVFILPAVLTTPLAFVIGMILAGVGSGLCDVLMNARVGDLEARLKRPLMNANHGVFSVGYMVAALVTGVARDAGIAPIWVFGGWAIVVVGIAAASHIEIEAVEADPPGTPKGRYPFWPVLMCGSVVLIAFFTEATVENWSALHIERTLNGGAGQGALGPATLGLMMAIGRFSGQAVSERFSDYSVILGGTLMASCGAVIAAMAPAPVWAYLGFGILGLGVSVIGPLGLAIVGRVVPARLRTDAISKVAVMGFSGFFLAPVLMGGLSQVAGLRWAFGAVAIFVLLLLPITLLLRKRAAPQSS